MKWRKFTWLANIIIFQISGIKNFSSSSKGSDTRNSLYSGKDSNMKNLSISDIDLRSSYKSFILEMQNPTPEHKKMINCHDEKKNTKENKTFLKLNNRISSKDMKCESFCHVCMNDLLLVKIHFLLRVRGHFTHLEIDPNLSCPVVLE